MGVAVRKKNQETVIPFCYRERVAFRRPTGPSICNVLCIADKMFCLCWIGHTRQSLVDQAAFAVDMPNSLDGRETTALKSAISG